MSGVRGLSKIHLPNISQVAAEHSVGMAGFFSALTAPHLKRLLSPLAGGF